MSVVLSPLGGAGAQFFDNNGAPLAGGKLYTYAAGTTTPLATYTTSAGNVAHANPIVLDSAGRVPGGQLWYSGASSYKFVLTTAADVAVATWDNLGVVDASMVPFTPPSDLRFDTDTDTVSEALIDLGDNIIVANPTGSIQMYAGTVAPFGWLNCDGSVVAQADYPDLFGVIGNTFNTGAEGTGNFRLPDLRGRAPIGLGAGSGLTDRTLGAKGGEEIHVLNESEIPPHAHSYSGNELWQNLDSGGYSTSFPGGSFHFGSSLISTDDTGGGLGHNNMQPFLTLNFIIRT